MRKRLHLLLREAAKLPPLDPRPRPHIRNTVLALALARKVVPRLTRVLPRQANLEHAVNPERLVLEPRDRVGNLLLRELEEVVDLALVGGAAAVPEEEPLQHFAVLEGVGKAEFVVLVVFGLEVEEFG